jgi:putative transposase
MDNHYHLLVHTLRTNLSVAMRHLQGLYTQPYNRMKQTDEPLFRGRFKGIFVDADHYLAHLSRYIHLDPVVAKITESAQAYR